MDGGGSRLPVTADFRFDPKHSGDGIENDQVDAPSLGN
jgi:hypothetical protein